MFPRILCLFSAGLLLAQTPGDPAATGRKAVDLLLGGQYPELEAMFAPNVQESLKLDALTKLGNEMKSFGKAEIGAANVRVAGSTHIVIIPLKFESRNVNMQMGISQAGLITGFFALPGAVAWQHPPYSKPDSFLEREVSIGDAPYKLPGTLTVPKGAGPFPAVVLVHGTGPNDRDETVAAIKVFKDLAEGLASRGIAVLRYEKRTKLYLARMSSQPYTADDETTDDAVSALEVLRAQPEVNKSKVYVLGHSLGGYLAPRIAEEDGKLAGMIVLSAGARPLEDIIVEQAEQLLTTPAPNEPATAAAERAKELANIKTAAARVKKLEAADEDRPNVLGLPVAYWVDLKGYDPVATTKKLAIPVMVLQGERDFQVSMNDFNVWKAGLSGQKGAVIKSYPPLNHLFVAGAGKSSDAEYRKPGHVDPGVIDELAAFIKQ